ncbi:Cu-binding protein [Schaereria dolodes]|nr:Cu-binding protein [Schaereria dolodes]
MSLNSYATLPSGHSRYNVPSRQLQDVYVKVDGLNVCYLGIIIAYSSFAPIPVLRKQRDVSAQLFQGHIKPSRKPAHVIGLPFSTFAAILFLAAGVGMVFYFRYEKARVERLRVAEAAKGVGRPKVGGKFELLDQDGRRFSSEEDMKGRFSLVYFGFTHCPDICPEELDKMAQMIDLVRASTTASSSSSSDLTTLLPLFITCDPARDTPSVLKTYLKEFHDGIIGLTGTWEQIKAVCKAYRVYFSTPEGVKPGMDYLVDHSIYFYLMDPEGDFIEAIGRQHSAEKAAQIIIEHMGDWKGRAR